MKMTGSEYLDPERLQIPNLIGSRAHRRTYNTTLRSIIPLPDPTGPTHLSSHPRNLEDFPKGSKVLGLYPDTTSFYGATVIAAPTPGTGMGPGLGGGRGSGVRADKGAQDGAYVLSFVDDGDNTHVVDKIFVIKVGLAGGPGTEMLMDSRRMASRSRAWDCDRRILGLKCMRKRGIGRVRGRSGPDVLTENRAPRLCYTISICAIESNTVHHAV